MINDMVLIRLAKPPEKSAGGIILLEQEQDKKLALEGTIVSVGRGPFGWRKRRKTSPVEPGQRVVFTMWETEQTVRLEGVDHAVVHEDEVLLILEGK